MKRFNLLMIAIVLATLPAATLQAQEGGPDYKHKLIDGLWYTLDSVNYCATVGCRLGSYGYEYSGDIVIPEKVVYNDASYTVVGIEEQAFRGSSITSLIMPNTITTIGKSCFCYCYNLNPVILSENISELPSESFYECAIKSIDFPEGLKTIREKHLRDVTV